MNSKAYSSKQNHDIQRRRHSFSISRIFGDPFALSTISIGFIGWVIALVGSISTALSQSSFPVFAWWGIAFEFLIIVGITYVFGAKRVDSYRLAIIAFLATSTVYTTNSTNNFVYLTSPTTAAAAAGYILLSIINIIWIFYLGTTTETKFHSIVDGYSLTTSSSSSFLGNGVSSSNDVGAGAHHLSHLHNGVPNSGDPFSLDSRSPGAVRERSQHFSNDQYQQYGGNVMMTAPIEDFENTADLKYRQSDFSTTTSEISGAPTEYPHRARAVYTYTANPDDPNELSFEKGEILEVSDIGGRWWQARRANGEVGICPSNYVTLLQESP